MNEFSMSRACLIRPIFGDGNLAIWNSELNQYELNPRWLLKQELVIRHASLNLSRKFGNIETLIFLSKALIYTQLPV